MIKWTVCPWLLSDGLLTTIEDKQKTKKFPFHDWWFVTDFIEGFEHAGNFEFIK